MRCGRLALARSAPIGSNWKSAAVLGTDALPSFSRYHFKAIDVLRLYRDFWRLLYMHPPAERPDLMFQLRKEFRSKSRMRGGGQIRRAYDHGVTILESKRAAMAGITAKQDLVRISHGGGGSDHTISHVHRPAGYLRQRPSLPRLPSTYAFHSNDAAAAARGTSQIKQPLSAETTWELFRVRSGDTIPGLRNVPRSQGAVSDTNYAGIQWSMGGSGNIY